MLRLSLLLVRMCSWLVPADARADWRAEWQAEVHHYWLSHARRGRPDWSVHMNLIRRTLGALPDAAWLRRQFTADAEVVHDVRHGVRMLRQSPTFALSAIAILGIGIGGTVAIVALLDTLFLRPLPYADAERVVTIWQRHAARPGEQDEVAPANFIDWRARSRSFSAIAAAVPYSRDYTGGSEPEVLFGAQVTEGFFDAIGMPPALGRGFRQEEHTGRGSRVVVISHGFWQSRFAGNPNVIGSTISLDDEAWTIVGVLPATFAPQLLPRPGELTVWTPKVLGNQDSQIRSSGWWNAVGRLAPGVTLAQAQSEMDAIAASLGREYPKTNASSGVVLVPMREHLMGGVSLPLFLMLGAVMLVLGIGCANVANLLLARGLERSREFAIRSALGAGRSRLVRQLVTESLLLSTLAAGLGIAVARWSLQAIVALAPAGLLRLQTAAIDGRALLFAIALTIVTAIAFGIVPALQFSRRLSDLLRVRQTSVGARLRRGLVVAEVAVAVVLLVGAGLLVRSFGKLLAVDPGFNPSGVVMAQMFVGDRHGTPERIRTFFDSTIDRLSSLPGVEAAGAVSAMPFALSSVGIRSGLQDVGRPPVTEGEQPVAYVSVATPGYFRAMSIPLREGRLLEESDREHAPRVAVISDGLRRREWPAESPVGRRIRISFRGEPAELEIVGVVSQIRHDGLDAAARPEVFIPLQQFPFASMTVVARGSGQPSALIDRVKHQIWAVDSLQTIYDTASVAGLVEVSLVRQRFSMTVLAAFALVALLLCASGIYSIISVTTTQRTREIGVRMALGADGAAIRRMVLREGTAMVVAGIGLGLAAAAGGSQLMGTLLFDVRPNDPVTLVAVCLLLALVGVAACYLPAHRATQVDPLTVLRID